MSDLVAKLKEAMGYTTEIASCCKCKYYIEEEDTFLDRNWISYCDYNKIKKIEVGKHGRCNMFENK